MSRLKDKEYERRIKYLKESYKNKEIRDFIDDFFDKNSRFRYHYVSFGKFITYMEKEKRYLENDLLSFDIRRDISRLYNETLIYLGMLQRRPEEYKTWNKPYISRKLGMAVDKDKDFYSIDINYLFKSNISKDEMKNIVTSGDFKKDAIDAAFIKLQKSKKYQDISKSFLAVKKAICRFQYKELIVTVGLRNDILKLKEEMQEDLIIDKEMY